MPAITTHQAAVRNSRCRVTSDTNDPPLPTKTISGTVPNPNAAIVAAPAGKLAVLHASARKPYTRPAGQEAGKDARQKDVAPARRTEERAKQPARQTGGAGRCRLDALPAQDRRQLSRQDAGGDESDDYQRRAGHEREDRLSADDQRQIFRQPQPCIAECAAETKHM